MQSYRGTTEDEEDGSRGRRLIFSSYLQTPTRFIGEVHTVLSFILIVTFSVVITIYSVLEDDTVSAETADYRLGVMTFLSVSLVGCCLDLGLGLFLVHAAKEMSRSKCEFWWRCTFVSAVLSCFLSMCFAVLVGTAVIILAILPNAAFKPFALYVVGGFLGDITQTRAKMKSQINAFRPESPEDWVDSRHLPPPPPPRPPSSASTSRSSQGHDARERSAVVYTTDDLVSGGDTGLATASIVEEIVQEKFHSQSKSPNIHLRPMTKK